jgi:hypothetical protein
LFDELLGHEEIERRIAGKVDAYLRFKSDTAKGPWPIGADNELRTPQRAIRWIDPGAAARPHAAAISSPHECGLVELLKLEPLRLDAADACASPHSEDVAGVISRAERLERDGRHIDRPHCTEVVTGTRLDDGSRACEKIAARALQQVAQRRAVAFDRLAANLLHISDAKPFGLAR